MPSRILEVPLLEPDSFLTIDVGSDLPDDPTEVCQLFADEKCAPKWWLAIAAAYTQRNAVDPAIEVITAGLEKSPNLETEADRAPFLTMLSWLYLQKMRGSPTVDKKEWFDKALEYGNAGFRAYQQNSRDIAVPVPALLAQGTLVAAVGNFNDALQPFQSVLTAQPNNIFAKMGRARILYFRRNYRGALKLYQEVLRQAPDFPGAADPRIGLGLCFWQLSDRTKAKLAWERVLKLNSDSDGEDGGDTLKKKARAVAHTCLGLWYLDAALHGVRADFERNYVASINHFQQAYMGGQVPLPALKIASYLFSKHDMAKVGKLTDKVLESATLPDLLGEALFWKARAAHYAGDLDTALTLYTQATSADPDNVAAAIGKGIVEIAQDRAPEALLTFELLVQSHPRSLDALFYAGLFTALKGTGDSSATKAREILESYVYHAKQAHENVRPEALATLSQLWEAKDTRRAYECLTQAASLLKSVPLPVTINLSVLAFTRGAFEEAERLLVEVEATTVEDKYANTIKYNLARIREQLGKIDEARSAYTELGSLDDARARLLLLGKSPVDELRVDVKRLLDESPRNLELRALYAWSLRYLIQFGSKEVAKQAANLEQEFHKQTLSTIDKHDAYALVAMGNIYLYNAQAQPKSETAKRQRAYMRAAEFFEKALQLDKHNAYAAQGIGIALAETKRSDLALPILTRVRETLGFTDVHAFINNAHCLMDLGDYTRASDMYAQAYKLAPEDPSLLVLLGRAWLARGSRAKDIEALESAVEWAQKAVELAPDSAAKAASQFNLAYVQLQHADVLRRKPAEQRSLAQLEAAQSNVDSAITVLKQFIENTGDLPFSSTDLDERLDHAEAVLLPQLLQAIDIQKGHERKAEEKRAEAQRKRDEELRIQEEARLKLEQERAEREAKLEEERLRLQAQAAEWEAERAAEREQREQQQQAGGSGGGGGTDDDKKKKKKGRRAADDDLIDDSELPELSDVDSEDEKYKRRGKPKKKSSSVEPEKVVRTQNVVDDDDDDYDNVEEKVERKQNVVEDDDDDDDDDEEPASAPSGAPSGAPAPVEPMNQSGEPEGGDDDGMDDLF